jgi:signal peptidase II
MKRKYLVVFVIASVLLLDQLLKVYIKLNFDYNEDRSLLGFMGIDLPWARLHFVENEGMAFGITFGWQYGKLLLSLFRIVMVAGLFWYIGELIRIAAPKGLLTSISLITAGAIGNIIDSAFYGLLFTESPYHGGLATAASQELPAYGTFLHGKVVDMLYFPIKYIDFPDWFPFWGGDSMLFFSPIFNIADAAITSGVLSILLFQRGFFKETTPDAPTDTTAAHTTSDVTTAIVAGDEDISELSNDVANTQEEVKDPLNPPTA